MSNDYRDTLIRVLKARDIAAYKAIDSLARYKFEMFGYHASAWVKYNQLLPKDQKDANPFSDLVKLAFHKRDHEYTNGGG